MNKTTPRHKQPEYRIWCGMLTRCRNPNRREYKYYGARGIRVCDRWMDYDNFLADMGPRPTPKHSVERVNNDGDYEPDNCVWIHIVCQAKNKRKRLAPHLIEKDMCASAGVNYDAWRWRVRKGGMTQQEALAKPFIKKKWDRIGDRLITIDGVTKKAKEWCIERGMQRDTFRYRVRCGMTLEQALNTPLTNLGRYKRK